MTMDKLTTILIKRLQEPQEQHPPSNQAAAGIALFFSLSLFMQILKG